MWTFIQFLYFPFCSWCLLHLVPDKRISCCFSSIIIHIQKKVFTSTNSHHFIQRISFAWHAVFKIIYSPPPHRCHTCNSAFTSFDLGVYVREEGAICFSHFSLTHITCIFQELVKMNMIAETPTQTDCLS